MGPVLSKGLLLATDNMICKQKEFRHLQPRLPEPLENYGVCPSTLVAPAGALTNLMHLSQMLSKQ